MRMGGHSHARRARINRPVTSLALLCRSRSDRDDAPAPPGRELDGAGGARVQRVVLADPHAVAGVEARAALPTMISPPVTV